MGLLVCVRDILAGSCGPVFHLGLLSVRDTLDLKLTAGEQDVRDVVVSHSCLAHDTFLFEDFLVYKKGAKSFFEELLFVVDATSVVVAATNKVNSVTEKHVLGQFSRLNHFYIPLNFLSETVKLDARAAAIYWSPS